MSISRNSLFATALFAMNAPIAAALPPLPATPEMPTFLTLAPAPQGRSSPFHHEESALIEALGATEEPGAAEIARRSLARFYLDSGLHVEALAALGDQAGASDDDARLMIALCQYSLGRFESAFEVLSDERLHADEFARMLRVMTLAALGAFVQANAEFGKVELFAGAPPGLAAEFYIAKTEAALAVGDFERARIAHSHGVAAPGAEQRAADFALLRAMLAVASGDRQGRELMSAASKTPDARVAALARLRGLAREMNAGGLPRGDLHEGLRSLALQWSGGAFERELLSALAASAPPNATERIDALGRLARDFPLSDAAGDARVTLGEVLQTLVSDETRAPRTVARIFYENIEFAPLGADGDAIIRALSVRLVKLDLLAEAAELLSHQVFKRLRGVERSKVAADLAQIYLDDRRPAEAVRAIRSTRIAGIDDVTLRRRRMIEATALERTGEARAALELLRDTPQTDELLLRAQIEWRLRAWDRAGASYSAILRNAVAPLDKGGRIALLRAGAAFLLANDRSSFDALRSDASHRFGHFPEHDLLNLMRLEERGAGAKFLDAYRGAFEAEG